MRAPLTAASERHAVTRPDSGHSALGGGDPHVHTEQGSHGQKGIAHVVAGVPEVAVADLRQGLRTLFGHREDVTEALGGVGGVGQPVEDRHTGVLGEFGDDGLSRAAVLDAVEHAAEDTGGVGEGLLDAEVGVPGAEVGGGGSLVGCGGLEGAAGTCGGLLEDQGQVPAGQARPFGAQAPGLLEVGGEIQEMTDLRCGEVELAQVGAASQVDGHGGSSWLAVRRPGRVRWGSSCSGGHPGHGRARHRRW